MADKKIEEGLQHLNEAEKCLKTSFFKWKPDLDGAGSEYGKAAVCFKCAKSYEKARDAYLRAAEVHKRNKILFHAARAYEDAGMMLKEMKNYHHAVDLLEKAADLFRENGSVNSAAITMEKAAKMVEPHLQERAVDLYLKASDIAELDEKHQQAANNLAKAARLLVRITAYDRAVEVLQREHEIHIENQNADAVFKNVLITALVHFQRNDFVAADKIYKQGLSYPDFVATETGAALGQLLEAYEEQDGETVRRIVSLPLFKYMDNDYAKLARSLRVEGSGRARNHGNDGVRSGEGHQVDEEPTEDIDDLR